MPQGVKNVAGFFDHRPEAVSDQNRRRRQIAAGKPLGGCHHIRGYPKAVGAEPSSDRKSTNDLIELGHHSDPELREPCENIGPAGFTPPVPFTGSAMKAGTVSG